MKYLYVLRMSVLLNNSACHDKIEIFVAEVNISFYSVFNWSTQWTYHTYGNWTVSWFCSERNILLFELRHVKFFISIAISLLLNEYRLTSSKNSYQLGYNKKNVFGILYVKNYHNDWEQWDKIKKPLASEMSSLKLVRKTKKLDKNIEEIKFTF